MIVFYRYYFTITLLQLEYRIKIHWKHFTLARWTIITAFSTTPNARNALSLSKNGPNKVHFMHAKSVFQKIWQTTNTYYLIERVKYHRIE